MFSSFKRAYHTLRESFQKREGLLGKKFAALFQKRRELDEAFFEEFEEILYAADFGSQSVESCLKVVREKATKREELLPLLKEELLSQFLPTPSWNSLFEASSPRVLLIVGSNGQGKTTSIAKLGSFFKREGKSVLLAAADTFRAAAIEQLTYWSQRIGVDLISSKMGADPSSVAYDAIQAACARKVDLLLIDTAGRLQTKKSLLMELEKLHRVCQKALQTAPHECWIVLDANVGQNAIQQARIFGQHLPLTGIILSKLDGRSRGGAIVSVQRELSLPIRWMGVGEGVEDIAPFEPQSFVQLLLSQ